MRRRMTVIFMWLMLGGYAWGGCASTEPAPIPPLHLGEFRESTSGPESMARPGPTSALRALVQAVAGPFECEETDEGAECCNASGDVYALESCRLDECAITFNGDVVGRLAWRVNEQTWVVFAHWGEQRVQAVRDGVGAITWVEGHKNTPTGVGFPRPSTLGAAPAGDVSDVLNPL